jgi:hypothetical protein
MLKTVSSVANALGALNYKGTWNASTNTPALASGVGTKGDYYVVSVAGATDLDGITNWGVGDWATFNGSVWQRVEGGADGNFVNLDVTGTATMGGLTVDAGASDALLTLDGGTPGVSSADAKLAFIGSFSGSGVGGYANIRVDVPSGGKSDMYFQTALSGGSGGVKDRLKIDGNGDVSFYEDTGTTPKFVWSASAESLGIGTSSPSAKLSLQTATGANNTSYNIIDATTDNPTYKAQINLVREDSSGKLGWAFLTNNVGSPTAAMNISAAGNVGIGCTPTTKLEIAASNQAATENTTLRFTDTDTTSQTNQLFGKIEFNSLDSDAASPNRAYILSAAENSLTPSYIAFGTAPHTSAAVERARLTSDGNFLVGTTSVQGAGGVTLSESGYVYSSRPSSTAIYADRTGSDGTIQEFRKDGTSVGSIGVVNANNLTIGGQVASHAGMEFGTNQIAPRSGGTSVDATVDLGYFSLRWKDLYLSGGVYLGGTGAANKLDDYEEGTWTPAQGTFTTWTSPTFTAEYTKIGRMVTLNLRQTGGTIAASSGAKYITGLPFTTATFSVGAVSQGGVSDLGLCVASGNSLYFTNAIASENDLIATITYYV